MQGGLVSLTTAKSHWKRFEFDCVFRVLVLVWLLDPLRFIQALLFGVR